MTRREGYRLEELKSAYQQLPVSASIDDAIRRGIAKGQARAKRRRTRRIAYGVAVMLVVLLVASASFSPTLSAYMGKLPMLQLLSHMHHDDAGLEVALENDYMQPIGKSVEHDGITFTLDDLIVDETRMIGFFTITDKVGYVQFGSVQSKWIDADTGTVISGLDNSFSAGMPDKQSGRLTGKVEVFMQKPTVIPDDVTLKVHLDGQRKGDAVSRPLNQEWKLNFKIDKSKFTAQKKVIDLNQTVNLDGQKVTFLQATLLPTTTRLDFTIDPHNTKQIFKMEDLRLVDETGREWKPLDHFGYSQSYINDGYGLPYASYRKSLDLPPDVISIYFESSYLTHPSSLTLVGSTIRALDKDKLDVWVDLDHQKLLKAPDDRLKLKSAMLYPELLEIIFQEPRPTFGGKNPTFEGYQMVRVPTLEEYNLKLTSGGTGACGSTYPPPPTLDLCFDTKYKDIPMQHYLSSPLMFRIVDYGYDKLHIPFQVKIK